MFKIKCPLCRSRCIPIDITIGPFRCPSCNEQLEVSDSSYALIYLLIMVGFYFSVSKGNDVGLALVFALGILVFIFGDTIPSLLGMLKKSK